MSQSNQESVQLRFSYSEKEYLDAVRFYFRHSKELLARLIVVSVLPALAMLLIYALLDFEFPLWVLVIFMFLGGLGIFHGFVIDLPRKHFRGDPKFRDEYNLTFTDSGIEFKTPHVNSSVAWSLYTRVIENDSFYILIYGKNIHSLSILPKRVFRDSQQETVFREMLRRHIDPKFKADAGELEKKEYVPASLEPPDWR